jgi:uncharacterized protein YbaR (Trm112 family)
MCLDISQLSDFNEEGMFLSGRKRSFYRIEDRIPKT